MSRSSSSSSNETLYASINDEEDDQTSFAKVIVKTLEKGFLIKVVSEKSCPGLLVYILETFEELSLQVLDARVSCTDCFQLEATGEENDPIEKKNNNIETEENEGVDSLDAQVVRQAVLRSIKNWSGSTCIM